MFRLQPQRFNAWLNNIGQDFAWRHSFSCPCYESHSGAPDNNCALCGGRGRIWDAAVKGRSGIAGQKVQRAWAEFGFYEDGDIVLTIPSDSSLYAMGELDRVSMLNSSMPFSRNMTRGEDDVFNFPVVAIDRLFWKGNDEKPVEGDAPTVNENGTITYGVIAPQPGTQFSITGRKRPEYFCFREFPQDRAHHGGLDLPRRVVLRRFDLFGLHGNT